jgi:hypothetical protein
MTSWTPLVLTPLSRSLAASATGWRGYEIRYHVDPPEWQSTALLPGTVAGDFQRPWMPTERDDSSVVGLYRDPAMGTHLRAEWTWRLRWLDDNSCRGTRPQSD